jgi:hypothetical protein
MSVATDDAVALGQAIGQWWVDEWAPLHKSWVREWSAGDKEELQFSDEFASPPRVISCKGTELRFQLEGKSSAKSWKDWIVSRIIPDLRTRFPQVGEFRDIQG